MKTSIVPFWWTRQVARDLPVLPAGLRRDQLAAGSGAKRVEQALASFDVGVAALDDLLPAGGQRVAVDHPLWLRSREEVAAERAAR